MSNTPFDLCGQLLTQESIFDVWVNSRPRPKRPLPGRLVARSCRASGDQGVCPPLPKETARFLKQTAAPAPGFICGYFDVTSTWSLKEFENDELVHPGAVCPCPGDAQPHLLVSLITMVMAIVLGVVIAQPWRRPREAKAPAQEASPVREGT